MACMGPQVNEGSVEDAYNFIMGYLATSYYIQNGPVVGPLPFLNEKWETLRQERNENFKYALRKLFELDAFESF